MRYTANVNSMPQQVQENTNNIEKNTADIQANTEAISKLDPSQIIAIETQVKNNTQQIDVLHTMIGDTDTDVANLKVNVNTNTGDISTLKENIANQRNLIDINKGDIVQLKSIALEQGNAIVENQASIETVNEALKELGDLDAEQIANLTSDVATIKAQIQSLNITVYDNKNKITELQQNLSLTEQDVVNLTLDVDALKNKKTLEYVEYSLIDSTPAEALERSLSYIQMNYLYKYIDIYYDGNIGGYNTALVLRVPCKSIRTKYENVTTTYTYNSTGTSSGFNTVHLSVDGEGTVYASLTPHQTSGACFIRCYK